MNKKFNVAVVIGRHQISHVGHELLKRKALDIAERVVIIIGSSFQSRNPRNPFKWTERRDMILSTLSEEDRMRTACVPIRDYYNDDRWNAEVKRIVGEYASQDIALVGHKKVRDIDTYYLDDFKEWSYIPVESNTKIDASELRSVYFEAEDVDVSLSAIADWIQPPVKQYLKAWSLRAEYRELVREYRKVKQEQDMWKGSPYPVIFSTADAVVKINNSVLLGKRKNYPGKGLWALPGGFVETGERVFTAALRELKEETQIGLMPVSLINDFKAVKVFDHPKRSCRGRVITHVHFFELRGVKFPAIQAADDLEEVAWIAIDRLNDMEELFFEDHFHILNEFLGLR